MAARPIVYTPGMERYVPEKNPDRATLRIKAGFVAAGIPPDVAIHSMPKSMRRRAYKIVEQTMSEVRATKQYKEAKKKGGKAFIKAMDGSGLPKLNVKPGKPVRSKPKPVKSKPKPVKSKSKPTKTGNSSGLTSKGFKKGSGPQGLLPGQHRNAKNGRFT